MLYEKSLVREWLDQIGRRYFVEHYFELKAGLPITDRKAPSDTAKKKRLARRIFERGSGPLALSLVAASRVSARLSETARAIYLIETGNETGGQGMYQFPIGAMLDSFRLDTMAAIKKAASLGAVGLQMYATDGVNSPDNMTADRKREILSAMNSEGLVFSALCGDLGFGFADPLRNPALIEKSKRILTLAKELGTDVVTTHIGVIPKDKTHDRYKIMQEACHTLAEYADSLEAHFAIETGPETADVLKGFLDSLGSRGVAVNLDPANFVMVTGDDPVKAVYTLKDYIVHTHAKDGIKIFDKDPEMIYRVVEDALAHLGSAYQELPLGKGHVDFPNYLKALDEIGYRGFLTIERECGDDPAYDIGEAIGYLKKLLKA